MPPAGAANEPVGADKIEGQTRALSDVTAERDRLREAVKVKDEALLDMMQWASAMAYGQDPAGHKGFLASARYQRGTTALNFIPPQGAGGRDAAGTAERIVRAAIKMGGAVFSVPQPRRHGTIIRLFEGARGCGPDEQGFLTSTGRFVDRLEARDIAERAKQLLPNARNHRFLFSEDVWETPSDAAPYLEAAGELNKTTDKDLAPKPDPKPVLRFKVGDKVKAKWFGTGVVAEVIRGWRDYRVQIADSHYAYPNDSDLEPAEAEPTLTRADVRREFIALVREYNTLFLEELAKTDTRDNKNVSGSEARALSRMEAGK